MVIVMIFIWSCVPLLSKHAKMGKLALLSITSHEDGFDINACKEQQNVKMHFVNLINSNQDSVFWGYF